MKKTAVVYWSGSGNTEAMAEAVAAGSKAAGGEAELYTASEFTPNLVQEYETIAFGCPAMGAEELEASEFEPMFSSCERFLAGKKIALFGSYGWGDGAWMETWQEHCEEIGANLAAESVICCGAPDAGALQNCRELGKTLAETV